MSRPLILNNWFASWAPQELGKQKLKQVSLTKLGYHPAQGLLIVTSVPFVRYVLSNLQCGNCLFLLIHGIKLFCVRNKYCMVYPNASYTLQEATLERVQQHCSSLPSNLDTTNCKRGLFQCRYPNPHTARSKPGK